MRKVVRAIDTGSNMSAYFCGLLVLLMMSIIMVEVFMRYVLNRAPGVADEISAYMYVGIVFIGLAYTWKEKAHVRLDVAVSRLSTGITQWLRLPILIMALTYAIVASKACWDYVLSTAAMGLVSSTWLRIPLQWPELPLAIGFSLLSLQLAVEIVKAVRDIRSRMGEKAI